MFGQSVGRGKSYSRPRTDKPLPGRWLCTGRANWRMVSGKNFTETCDFHYVVGGEDDFALSPACVGEPAAGRTFSKPCLCASHKGGCLGRFKEFKIHQNSLVCRLLWEFIVF